MTLRRFRRRVIQREISRVLVLNPLWQKSGAKNTDRIFLSLTPPSLLSRGILCRVRVRLASPPPAALDYENTADSIDKVLTLEFCGDEGGMSSEVPK